MNKKLIALAVAGAFVAPVAMAQTANPVTLYGRVHVTLESVESKGSGGLARRTRVEDQASLLGVRGTEDLGGGLKAWFQLETAFRPDSNNSTFAGRNSGIGLQGGWGTLGFGRWDTPFKVVTGNIDPFGDVTIAGITQANNDQGNFDRREQNVIQYWTPSWGGFTARFSYTANEGKSATANPYSQGLSVAYTGGPVYVFGAYEEHKDQLGSTVTSGSTEKGTALGGTFQFGPFRLGGTAQEYKKTNRTKKKSYLANAVWTVGNHGFIYQYQQSKDGGSTAAGTVQPDCDSNTIAWQYNFSKRTTLFTLYTKVDNNETANCGTHSSGINGPTGTDPQGVSFGVRHVF
jgi:predicted porin